MTPEMLLKRDELANEHMKKRQAQLDAHETAIYIDPLFGSFCCGFDAAHALMSKEHKLAMDMLANSFEAERDALLAQCEEMREALDDIDKGRDLDCLEKGCRCLSDTAHYALLAYQAFRAKLGKGEL